VSDAVDLGDAYAHCDAAARAGDKDRWLATLFAPAAHRPALAALYAFNLEIAGARARIREPMAGEIRLQWWREAIEGRRPGEAAGHPVAAALLDAITRYRLPRKALTDLIEARVFDLYDDPMPSSADLDGYCGETQSSLFRLAALILADGADPGGAEAAAHAGVAWGLVGVLRALPHTSARGQVYLPGDLLARHGLTRADIVERRDSPGLRAALAEMRARARDHLEAMRDAASSAAPAARAALLPAFLCPAYLAAMERRAAAPFAGAEEWPQWRRQWILWRAARRL
jgi:phytoene synthase